MKVFVFDLLAYGQHLDHLKVGDELPYPLTSEHCDPRIAVRTYEEHLQAWEELDRLGFDGVGFNEHHTSPYGLMNSPNLMAAAAAQRTKNLKLLIYGNLLPMHQPLRLAEELAMIDCLSNGRLISGFARGIPREYDVFNVAMSESRARFEEAYDIVMKAWMQESFSHDGKFWSYKDVAIWPRPIQQPHPPVSIPVSSSQESLDWAAARGIPVTPGAATKGLREDVVRYFASALARNGRKFTSDLMWIPSIVYLADSKAQAVKENAPYHLYFNRTLYSHGSFTEAAIQKDAGYVTEQSRAYVRDENLKAYARSRSDFRKLTFEDVEKSAQNMPWGTADEVTQRLIDAADHAGAGTVLISLNRGAMPHDMFMNQIRRFAKEVLPALKAHDVTHARCLDGERLV